MGNVAQLVAACLPCTKHWVRSSVLSKPFKVLLAHNLGTQQMGTDRSEFQHDPGYWVDQGQPGFHDILFQKQRGRGERGGGRNNSESLIVCLNSFRFGELKKRLSSWVLAAQSWGLEFRSKFQYNVVVLPEPRELTLSSGLWGHMHTYAHICLHTHTNKIKINLKKTIKRKMFKARQMAMWWRACSTPKEDLNSVLSIHDEQCTAAWKSSSRESNTSGLLGPYTHVN